MLQNSNEHCYISRKKKKHGIGGRRVVEGDQICISAFQALFNTCSFMFLRKMLFRDIRFKWFHLWFESDFEDKITFLLDYYLKRLYTLAVWEC